MECDCGTKTEVELGEPLVCKQCGKKPSFRYTNEGFYRYEECDAGMMPIKEKITDFLMFKRLLFQVRDEALTEENYLHFLAGYFNVTPTLEYLQIPEKGAFKTNKIDVGEKVDKAEHIQQIDDTCHDFYGMTLTYEETISKIRQLVKENNRNANTD